MSRPFNTSQPLGRIMRANAWSVAELAAVTSINSRTITEYLAGRKVIPTHHLDELADTLGVDAGELVPDPLI